MEYNLSIFFFTLKPFPRNQIPSVVFQALNEISEREAPVYQEEEMSGGSLLR